MNGDRSVYIHWPFCRKKCRYCDFVSVPAGTREEKTRYLKALGREFRNRTARSDRENGRLQTVYLGGGTPSLLENSELCWLMDQLTSAFPAGSPVEVTLELNPADRVCGPVEALAEIGVTRLSVGIQSFQDRYLRVLGRRQTARENREFLHALARSPSNLSFSLDLIYGLPYQDWTDWQAEVETALSYHPSHVSIYNLTLSPAVPLTSFFRRHPGTFPGADREADLFEWTMDRLSGEGYHHYEISNFARPGHESRHNLAYWTNQETMGLGLGAWSYQEGRRTRNTRRLSRYLDRVENHLSPIEYQEELTPVQRARESFFLALRTSRGASLDLLNGQPGYEEETVLRRVDALRSAGFITVEGSLVFLTRSGILLANQVIQELID